MPGVGSARVPRRRRRVGQPLNMSTSRVAVERTDDRGGETGQDVGHPGVSIVLMNVSVAVRRRLRVVRLSSAGHMWLVGAWLLVQARKVIMMSLAYLLARWPLVEIEAAGEFVGDSSVEVLSPELCSGLDLRSAGCSWVVGVDAVDGAPNGHRPEQAGARVAARGRPGGCSLGSAGLFLSSRWRPCTWSGSTTRDRLLSTGVSLTPSERWDSSACFRLQAERHRRSGGRHGAFK